jgi:hypothetical protein
MLEEPTKFAEIKDLATIVGVIIALFAFIKGVLEYAKQGAQKRAEQFLEMRNRFKKNESFRDICALLEHDDPKLQDIEFKEKRDFLGFFEELALVVNSGLIRREIAHYMFGYYAIKCWRSENFWINAKSKINRDSIYWALFKDFVDKMNKQRTIVLSLERSNRIPEYLKRRMKFDSVGFNLRDIGPTDDEVG